MFFLNDHPNLQGFDIGSFSYGSPIDLLHLVPEVTLKIGKYCSFAAGIRILLGADHQVGWVTTYPFNVLYPDIAKTNEHPTSKGNIIIGNDVWVASGAVILSGVTIGDGAIIAANAVVTKNVAPYTIVAGNPAKQISERFTEEQRQGLLAIQWWHWPDDEVKQISPLLQSNRLNELFLYAKNRNK
ncbi:CatB-related O-acetyltransferase [Shouchella sp. JSM 1781072]|uniref:CatB-related O-acetyltransferase n=1 Tax=Bacillaceae TaxID=186817 RepID=UPI000C07C099|nr:CatB-related O-acetyltransferase [Bacillus sp. Marseille-P3800]